MADDPRPRMVDLAWGLVGLVGHELAAIVGHAPPGASWPLDRPYGRGGVSTCAMVARGLLRELGVPGLDVPYQPGEGLDLVVRLARRHGAWVVPVAGADLRPEPGDVVMIGAREGRMHTLVCVGWQDDSLHSVDGGQVAPDGRQCVAERLRPWTENGGRPRLGDRGVDGWACLDLLPFVRHPT